MDSTCIVTYLLELHGSDVAVAVLELHQEGEPEAGGALVHVEGDVLAPVPARRPATQPNKRHPSPVSTRASSNTFQFLSQDSPPGRRWLPRTHARHY